MKKWILLVCIFTWPILAFFISLCLYNIWFDTLDMIKYDPSYSPEFDQDKAFENYIYWSSIVISIIVEMVLIVWYRKYRKHKLDEISKQTAQNQYHVL